MDNAEDAGFKCLQAPLPLKPMRVNSILAMLLLTALSLSGCLGFGDEPADDKHTDECDASDDHEACHAGETPGGNVTPNPPVDGNVTPEIPNSPPVPVLTMTDAEGNVLTNMSYIMVGSNITFSPADTSDADGLETISLGGLFVQDAANTRGRSTNLITDGVLSTANFTFEKEGPVVAVLSVLDAAGASAAVSQVTYVNALQSSSGTFDAAAPTGVSATDCHGLSANAQETTLVDNLYSQKITFSTVAGARWIEATSSAASVKIAICDPDGNNISPSGQSVSTDAFEVPSGVKYYVFAVNTGSAGAAYSVDVVVHWEPKPVA